MIFLIGFLTVCEFGAHAIFQNPRGKKSGTWPLIFIILRTSTSWKKVNKEKEEKGGEQNDVNSGHYFLPASAQTNNLGILIQPMIWAVKHHNLDIYLDIVITTIIFSVWQCSCHCTLWSILTLLSMSLSGHKDKQISGHTDQDNLLDIMEKSIMNKVFLPIKYE